MWVLLRSGDTALVPEPSYPIHQFSCIFAGAEVNSVPLTHDTADFFADLTQAYERTWPRPRVVLVSFPHNPTGHCVDLDFFERLVHFARRNDVLVIHDFAYAEIVFDGYKPPSIFQVPGAKDVAVEFVSLSKSHSMSGWRRGLRGRQRRGHRRPAAPQELPRLRRLPAHPDRRHHRSQRLRRCARARRVGLRPPPRRAVRRPGAHRLARAQAARHDVRVGADPRALPHARLAGVQQAAAHGGQGGGQPGRRFRSLRRRLRALRAG